MKKKKIISFLLAGLMLMFALPVYSATSELPVRGRILLQVEEHGEAYYVPVNEYKKYYLGRPDDAFAIMREFGVGISNKDLTNIPIANFNLNVAFDSVRFGDSDEDGLSDAVERSFGTKVNLKDTDGDGFSDYTEIINGYSPLDPKINSKIVTDKRFASKHLGKIFLQVESLGEAWYVNPVDGKRYFLGKPEDAFSIMHYLGLGNTIPTVVGIR